MLKIACVADVISAIITWDTVHTLLLLRGTSNRSNFHHRSSECMFRFENGPNTEAAPNAIEFSGSTPNIRDNDRAMIYC
jgi:hypothetical protein